jgi:uncharacterized protein YoxC
LAVENPMTENQPIVHRLAAADRAHQKEAGGRLLLRSVKFVCAAVLGMFVLDVVFHLRAGWRLGLLLGLLGGVAVLFAAAWYLAFVRRNRLEHIARLLEDRDPALGSRLINLLQLQGQMRDASLPPLTRDLARQAVASYAAELRDTPLERLAWTGDLRRHVLRAAWALLGFIAVLAACFRVTTVELARFADPYGDHPPYSFTRLEIIVPGPQGTNVLYGRGLVVRVKTAGHQPREVFLTSHPPGHPEQAVTVPMFDKGRAGFDQLVDNIRTELVLYAHTKDRVSRSKQARIGVILTPQLERAFVRVAPPAYTDLKPEEKPYAFKVVQALAGSEVRFRLQSNRPLREGRLQITTGDQPPQRVKLTPSAENEVAGAFTAEESGRLRFTVTDIAGITSEGECEGGLTVTHDLPPEIRLTDPERDAFVAMDFKLKVRAEANDDYGLRLVRLHRGLNGLYSGPRVAVYDQVLRNSVETVDLNIGELGVQPGDVISLFAEAVDTAPSPHLARSQTVRLRIISVEDYNEFLREQTDLADTEAKYRSLMDDLEQLIEEQKKLGEAAEKLQKPLARADKTQRENLTRELDALLARQNELNQKLNAHAARMDHFVRDQPVYDVEKDLQPLLREQAEQIRRSTRTNNAAARNIARRSAPSSGGRQLSPDLLTDFKKESDDQVSRLGGAQQQTEQQVAQPLQDLSRLQELMKDFKAMEELYRAQQELAAQAQAYHRPGELSREDQLALKELAATEKQVDDALKLIGRKLRDDADAAKKLFPKAAQSGRDLADKMDELRLQPLAQQATGQMLAGNGERAFRLADRLRSEMEKLFGDCQACGGAACGSLDAYLKLLRMNPAHNFAQMSRSRKFGLGFNPGLGIGQGEGGTSGYAVTDGSTVDVMGNEFLPSRGSATGKQPSRIGKGAGALASATGGADPDKADSPQGLHPVNRQSGAVVSETIIEEYNDVVESYFKAITTRKKP